jgi:hypothetical protein
LKRRFAEKSLEMFGTAFGQTKFRPCLHFGDNEDSLAPPGWKGDNPAGKSGFCRLYGGDTTGQAHDANFGSGSRRTRQDLRLLFDVLQGSQYQGTEETARSMV